mgnify:CR=1 FL=1
MSEQTLPNLSKLLEQKATLEKYKDLLQMERYSIEIIYYNNEFLKFKEECSKTGTTEEAIAIGDKIGFKTNLIATNPLDPDQKVHIYFANFVLMDYGFGAVFGCPAHDQRDFDFAKKYNLKITTVVKPVSYTHLTLPTNREV